MSKPRKYKENEKKIAAGYPDKEYRWYVILVRSRYEKKADMILKNIGIQTYLPLNKKLNYWSDRRRWVECPLFPGYLFVYVNNSDYYNVFECPYVLTYVSFGRQPVPVSSSLIENIKSVLNSGLEYSVTESRLKINERIKLDCGPLKGCSGRLVEFAGKDELLISIDNVSYSLIVNIPSGYLIPEE